MYNGDGLRTQKKIQKGTNSFETHTYYWSDGKLLAETIQLDNNMPISLHYHYSHAGLTGFSYIQQVSLKDEIRKNFTYIKNSLGDIVGIYSSTGVMCTYTYDAWGGNCTITDHAFEIGIGYISALNPFRYRGYYFDSDLGLYYLQTRYYDPTTGRFISSDHPAYISEQMEQLGGCNLFAYCLNNPIKHTDPEGTIWHVFIATLIGAIVGAAWGAFMAAAEGKSAEQILKSAAVGAVAGALTGCIASVTAGMGAGALVAKLAINAGVGFFVGAGSDIIGQTWVDGKSRDEIDFGKAIGTGVTTAITTVVSFGIGTAVLKGDYVTEVVVDLIWSFVGASFGGSGGYITQNQKNKESLQGIGD